MTGALGVYVCEKCGNIVEVLASGGGNLVCCGAAMLQQKENTVDAAHEKHIPVVTVEGNKLTVQVGSTLHPMTAEHRIIWIDMQEDGKLKRVFLQPGDEPKAEFCTKGGKYTVRAYCNLHGLWMNTE
ncbi:MAG: desulfoferrodoxin [Planctomycetaceae bacterium]|nr:desulfoferrodoxin [Planctomycetaceae bacterium]